MPEVDPELAKVAQQIESDGVTRFGKDNWPVLIGAVHRAVPPGVNPAEILAAAIKTGDAANALARAGKEALAAAGSGGDREAEVAYSKIRNEERTAYRRSRGLIR
jgi:hypothetical protein